MKNMTKAIALLLSLIMLLTFPVGVSAAEVEDATIDMTAKGSLTIYKVDLTNAEKDGVWDSSYVSTGVYDQNVYDTLIGATRAGDSDNTSDLGNGEASHGYAVKGVEFTYLRVADIVQFTESTADGVDFDHVEVLYGIDKTKGADLLKALGLDNGSKRYENADKSDKLDSANYPDNVGVYEEYIRSHYLGRRTADCVGFIKGYCWYDPETDSVNYATNGMPDIGADQMYRAAAEKGPISTMPEIPGLAVWHQGHIGIYIGNGYAIEAMGTRYGVVKTRVAARSWTHWLKIPYINYIEETEEDT